MQIWRQHSAVAVATVIANDQQVQVGRVGVRTLDAKKRTHDLEHRYVNDGGTISVTPNVVPGKEKGTVESPFVGQARQPIRGSKPRMNMMILVMVLVLPCNVPICAGDQPGQTSPRGSRGKRLLVGLTLIVGLIPGSPVSPVVPGSRPDQEDAQ